MILALSTSSPRVSVALTASDGRLLATRSLDAPWAAGRALGSLTQQCLADAGARIDEIREIIADEGPGGFTGVRVGVMFAKSLAWALGAQLALVPAFDLIDPSGDAFVPMKKGEWLLRRTSGSTEDFRSDAPPSGQGYGRGIESPLYPDASLAMSSPNLKAVEAVAALPAYHAEPSISSPKSARVLGGANECP